MPGLESLLRETAGAVEAELERLVPPAAGPRGRVVEAMRYGLLGGGKRLRPLLVLQSAEICGAPKASALRAAAAVEMIHAYSLIHDDLPAMDDSALRRGRPSVHIAFDEATAILAGDGLLTLAFEVLSEPDAHPDPAVRAELVCALAKAAGAEGMVGGQMMDIAAESSASDGGLESVGELQRLKTGALFHFACQAGAILANAPMGAREALAGYAAAFGLAFQIADDLLDAEGEAGALGKPVGQDKALGKVTFPSLLGAEEARRRAQALVQEAIESLDIFGTSGEPLRLIVEYVTTRRQ